VISTECMAEIRRHEGFSSTVYLDSVGKRTIGYGWNLDSDPMYREAADVQMRCKLEDIEARLLSLYDWYPNLSQARKDVVLNMSYNLGVEGFGKFRQTIWYLANSRFEEAADEMLRSRWSDQVGNRAKYLANKMKVG
jgi:lysozyme